MLRVRVFNIQKTSFSNSDFFPDQTLRQGTSIPFLCFEKSDLSCFSRVQAKYLPTELSELIEHDLAEYKKQKEAEEQQQVKEEEDGTTVTVTTVTTTTTTKTEKVVTKKNAQESAESKTDAKDSPPLPSAPETQKVDSCLIDPGHRPLTPLPPIPMTRSSSPPPPPPPPPAGNNLPSNNMEIFEDENMLYLGLRVYTNKDAPAKVWGKLRSEMDSYPNEQRRPRSPFRNQYRSASSSPRR